MSNPDETPAPPTSEFATFGLDPRVLEALDGLDFETPTPIQKAAIGPLLEGRDVIGRARTGSGKTAAFGLPLLERVKEGGGAVKALVLAPTRELALQVTEALRSFAKKLPVRVVTIYGGAPYPPQLKALRKGVPVVVGTPGRVLDHMERGSLDLSALELLVLDEADEMLRMGFLEDVEKVLAASPDDRQVALFSATMPDPIRAVAERRLRDPVELQVEERALSTGHIQQRALLVPERHKLDALARLLASEPIESALVFTRTRAGCAQTADALAERGLHVDALHGDLNQAARERVLLRFRAGSLRVVIATDVASRGIDVDRISHVINYDLPTNPEEYVHRIGRTGRAGREGVAISLVTPRERSRVRGFERALKVQIEKIEVPTDADIAGAEKARLLRSVDELASQETSEGAEAILKQLVAHHDARAVAAAALRLLATDRGLALDAEHDERPPSWARKAPRPPRGSVEEIELFLPVGKKRGVRPSDLVGALANEAGVPGSKIGRVTILDHKSFVGVAKEEGERVLAERRELEVRGKKVPLARARPRSHGAKRPFHERGGRRQGGGKRKGPPHRKKRWRRKK